MTFWISQPSICVPEAIKTEPAMEVDPRYGAIYRAFSCSIAFDDDGLCIPRLVDLSREEFAARAVGALLSRQDRSGPPGVLVDCCSSATVGSPAPTYKLAVNCGLAKVLPFAVDGQAGAEVGHAMLFLRHILRAVNENAVVVATQRVTPPDSRLCQNAFPLADGVAAVECSLTPLPGGFEVVGLAVGQFTNNWQSILRSLLEMAALEAGVPTTSIQWSIAHRYSRPFVLAVEDVLPGGRSLARDLQLECNFGCADTLISLHRQCLIAGPELRGIGVLWFVGRFGSIAAVLVCRTA